MLWRCPATSPLVCPVTRRRREPLLDPARRRCSVPLPLPWLRRPLPPRRPPALLPPYMSTARCMRLLALDGSATMRGSDGWSPTRLASRWASPLNRTRCRARLAARFPSGDGRGRRLPGMERPGDSQWGSVGYMPVARCGEVLLTPKPCYPCAYAASACFCRARRTSCVHCVRVSVVGYSSSSTYVRSAVWLQLPVLYRAAAVLSSTLSQRRGGLLLSVSGDAGRGDANQSIATRLQAAAAAADSLMATATYTLHVLCTRYCAHCVGVGVGERTCCARVVCGFGRLHAGNKNAATTVHALLWHARSAEVPSTQHAALGGPAKPVRHVTLGLARLLSELMLEACVYSDNSLWLCLGLQSAPSPGAPTAPTVPGASCGKSCTQLPPQRTTHPGLHDQGCRTNFIESRRAAQLEHP